MVKPHKRMNEYAIKTCKRRIKNYEKAGKGSQTMEEKRNLTRMQRYHQENYE